MPKRILPLTDSQISKAKPKDKDQAFFDGGGLYLLVTPSGGKLWRLKYRFNGKSKLLAIGTYPIITLAEARQKRLEVKKQLATGVDPGEQKKALRAAGEAAEANSFGVIAREWVAVKGNLWSESHKNKVSRNLENNAFPWLESRPITEITASELLKVLRITEERVAETAHRLRWICSSIFRYAITTDRAERDPAADLQGAMKPVKKGHFAAVTTPKELAQVLKAIDAFTGSYVVKCALWLTPMLFVRPGELRNAEWAEIDLEEGRWLIPGNKMKMRVDHLVPLPRQAVDILNQLKPLTGHSKYVFPSVRTPLRCLSENTVNAAFRRLGYEKDEVTAHGFRATARTILDEVLGVRPDIIEHQLAHAVKDSNGRAYNRTSFIEDRKNMMQTWADYLDELKITVLEM